MLENKSSSIRSFKMTAKLDLTFQRKVFPDTREKLPTNQKSITHRIRLSKIVLN